MKPTMYGELLIVLFIAFAQCQLIILPANYSINSNTYYEVIIVPTVNDISEIQTAGWTTLALPTDSYDSTQISSASCSITCTITGNILNISNSFYDSSVLRFNLTSIINPPSAVGPIFTYTVYNSTGSITFTYSSGTFTISAGSLNSCRLTFNPNFVRKVGTATLEVSPGNKILQGGSLLIKFPNSWAYTINSQKVINSSLVTCAKISGSIGSAPSCSYDGSTTVTVSNIFTANTSAVFSLSLNPILSLPISYNSTEVSAQTADASGNIIDSYTACIAQAPSPNTFTITTVTTATVSRNFTPSLTFRSTDVINSLDSVRYTMPSDMSIQSANLITMSLVDTASTNVNLGIESSNSNTTSYSYTLRTFTLNARNYANANTSVTFGNVVLLAPPSSKPSGFLTISYFRNGAIYSTGSISFTALTSTLTSVSLSADNQLINANTFYTISFTTASPLSSTGWLTVQIPTTVITTAYTGRSCQVSGSTNVSTTATCQMSSNILTVTNAFIGLVPNATTFSVYFNGVANPESSATTTVFRISTFYESGNTFAVDTSNTVTFKATADTINSVVVTPGSFVVGSAEIYTITYTLKNQLPSGGTLLIGLPIGMALQNSASASVTMTIGSGSSTITYPSIVAGNSVYSSALNFTGIGTFISKGTVVTFQISKIVNPSSTRPSSTFSLYTFLQGNLIESLTSGLTVTMTTPAAFTFATIVADSKINGDSTYYILSIMPSISIPSGSILRLTIPSNITLASPVCTNITGTSASLSCTLFSSILSIPVTDLSNLVVYKYQISGFTNPRTMSNSGTFTLTCMTSDSSFRIAQATVSGITNTQANKIVTLTSQVTDPIQSYLNSSQTIFFNIVTKNPLQSSDYILLSFPSVYTYEGATSSVCTQPTSNYNCIPETSNPLTVKITGNFNNQTAFSFHIKNYRSPDRIQYINMTSYFLVYTKQADSTDIDVTDTSIAATKTTFTVSCDSNCKECTSTITTCTSCYPSTITNSQFLENGKCVSKCSTGNYSDTTTGSCLSCVSPCATCTSATTCLTCLSTVVQKFFDVTTNTCVAICPTGYFGSVDVCTPCSLTCKSCQNTSTNCISCNSSLVLHSNTCLTSCPTGFFNSSGNCMTCDVSCQTCLGAANNCTLCASGYATNGTAGVCTNNCPAGTVPYNGICSCLVSCKTCSGTFDNCLTCDPTSALYSLLYANTCVGSCPFGTYDNSKVCSNCPTGCASCISGTNCTTCTTSYYLYLNQCLQTCPTNTFTSVTTCQNCTSPCATCSRLATNCTACATDFALQGFQCVQNCSAGLPVSTVNGTICQPCTSNCSTCSVTLSNCTSCLVSSGTSLYQNNCVSPCPDGTTSVLNICQLCVSPCLKCNVSTTNCLSCLGGFYEAGSGSSLTCTTNCSLLGLFINGSQCIACQSPCASCSLSAYNCTSCQSGRFLQGNSCVTECSTGYYGYQGNCITSCPNGTVPSGKTCVDPTNNSTNNTTQNLTDTLQSSKIIPFPFFIAEAVTVGVILVSKFSAIETSVACSGASIGSLLEFASWGVLLVVVALQNNKLYVFKRLLFTVASLTSKGVFCVLISVAIHYILNIINFAFYLKYIATDEAYKKWLKTAAHTRVHRATLILSLIITHKFSNLPFSKFFGSSCFKAPLSKPQVYTPINVISGLSLISSIIMIIGCALIIYDSTTTSMSTLFIQCIDAIVVTSLVGIFVLWNIRKPDDFFDENSKLNTASQQIYNDTLAGMINNQSEFGERFSVDEAEEGALGKKLYRKKENGSKIANSRMTGPKDRTSIIKVQDSNDGINIHEMSSDYVSEQQNINEKTEDLLLKNKGQGQKVGKNNNSSDLSHLPQKSNIRKTDGKTETNGSNKHGQNGTDPRADNEKGDKSLRAEKSVRGDKSKGDKSVKGQAKQNDKESSASRIISKLDGKSQQQEAKIKKERKDQPALEIRPTVNEKQEENDSSIIDKMRDSQEFIVEEESGDQAVMDPLVNQQRNFKKQHSKVDQVDAEDKISKTNKSVDNIKASKNGKKIKESKGKGGSEIGRYNKNKVAPSDISDVQPAEESNDDEDAHNNVQINWNQSDSQQDLMQKQKRKGKSKEKSKEKSLEKGSLVGRDTSKDRSQKDKQKRQQAERDEKQSEDESRIAGSKHSGKSKQKLRDKSKEKSVIKSKDKSEAARQGQQIENKSQGSQGDPNQQNSSLSEHQLDSPYKMVTESNLRDDSPNKQANIEGKSHTTGLHNKSKDKNGSQKQKNRLKSDSQISRSVRQKTLKVQKMKHQEKQELQNDEQIDSINIDQVMPAFPNEIPAPAFPQSEPDLIQSQTLTGQGRYGRLKKGSKRRGDAYDSQGQHAFNTIANTSIAKQMDSTDSVPSKPLIQGQRQRVELTEDTKSKQTRIDSDFVNKFYNDNQSLRSIEDAHIEFNEISPSEFNIQNQRYEDSLDLPTRGILAGEIDIGRAPHRAFIGPTNNDHLQSFYDTMSYKQSDQSGGNTASNMPKGLSPQRRQNLPGNLLSRDADVYKSFSKLNGGVGYDGVYRQNEPTGNPAVDSRRMRDLEKIYLQRLDFKQDKKRTANSAFNNKKTFLDES